MRFIRKILGLYVEPDGGPIFVKRKDVSKHSYEYDVYPAWQFTRDNLKRSDSWVRTRRDELMLTSQYGGQKLWIERRSDGGYPRIELDTWFVDFGDGLLAFRPEEFNRIFEEVPL